MEFRKEGYRQRVDKQTLDWRNGKSEHNQTDDECCPDFSCCRPQLLAPREVREIFYNAYLKENHKTTERLLMEFLGRMIADLPGKQKVHIVGLDASRQEVD